MALKGQKDEELVMELIKEILEIGGKHSRAVIVVLLGLIAAGSVGGGLWIHSLQVVIENKDRLNEQRVSALKEQHDLELNKIRGHADAFVADFKKQTFIIRRATDQIAQLSKSPNLPASSKADLARIEDELLISLDNVAVDYAGSYSEGSGAGLTTAAQPSGLPLAVILIVFMMVAFVVATFVLIKHRKAKIKRGEP